MKPVPTCWHRPNGPRENELSTERMALLETDLGSGALPKRRGKVRDIYALGDRLLLVATDRISAFDWVLPTGIPDKGRVLTGLSDYWFTHLHVPDHRIATDVDSALRELPASELD